MTEHDATIRTTTCKHVRTAMLAGLVLHCTETPSLQHSFAVLSVPRKLEQGSNKKALPAGVLTPTYTKKLGASLTFRCRGLDNRPRNINRLDSCTLRPSKRTGKQYREQLSRGHSTGQLNYTENSWYTSSLSLFPHIPAFPWCQQPRLEAQRAPPACHAFSMAVPEMDSLLLLHFSFAVPHNSCR